MSDTSVPNSTFNEQIKAVNGEPPDEQKRKRRYVEARGVSDLEAMYTEGFIPISPLQLQEHGVKSVPFENEPNRWPSTFHEALAIRPKNQDGTFGPPNQYIVFDDGDPGRYRRSIKGAEQRASYYGNTNSPARVYYHESYFKAYTASLVIPDALHIGLNGLDGWSQGKDKRTGESIPIENLVPALPSQDVVACVVPDADHSGRVLGAIKRLAKQLQPHFKDVQLSNLPGAKQKWDLNDILVNLGEAALQHFLENTPTLYPEDQVNIIDHIQSLGDPSEPPEPVDWLWEDLVPRKSGVFVAPGDEGKSTYMSLQTLHTALGWPLHGYAKKQPEAVLFVSAEDGLRDIKQNIHNILRDRNYTLSPEELALYQQNVLFIDVKNLPATGLLTGTQDNGWDAGPTLRQVEDVLNYRSDIGLVILDNLASLGLQEQSGFNEAFAAYHRWSNGLCERYGCAFTGVVHVGQSAAQQRTIDPYAARSGTALVDNARWAHQYQRDRGTTAERSAYHLPPGVSNEDILSGEVRVYRLHAHKVKFSPNNAQLPLWVVSRGWDYQTFPSLSRGEADAARAQAAEDRTNEPVEAVYNAIRARIENDQLVLHSELGGLVDGIGKDRTQRIASDLAGGGRTALLRTEEYKKPGRGGATLRYFLNDV